MRIQKIHEGLYVKALDPIEQKLATVIKEEIAKIDGDDRATIEKIVQETLSRVKEELTNMNGQFGVISVNGQNGIVTISPANIQAEPAFSKRSAFNKEFGSVFNTVCEGNDARLSDARNPLPHRHDAGEIEGLDNLIGWNPKVVALEEKAHTHSNLAHLSRLIYTGNKSVLDLATVDALEKYTRIDIESVINHVNSEAIHVTTQDKTNWNSKETTSGAQTKATNALNSAKSYADTLKSSLINGASSSYQTLAGVESVIKNNVLPQINSLSDGVNNNLAGHTGNSTIHMSAAEKQLLNTVNDKASAVHAHNQYLEFYNFTSINDMPS